MVSGEAWESSSPVGPVLSWQRVPGPGPGAVSWPAPPGRGGAGWRSQCHGGPGGRAAAAPAELRQEGCQGGHWSR